MDIDSAKISSSNSSLVFNFGSGYQVKNENGSASFNVEDGELVVRLKGNFTVKIYRNKKLSKLVSGGQDAEKNIKGKILGKDRFIVATDKFFEKVSEETLIFCFENLTAEDLSSKLSITLDSQENNQNLGAIVLYFNSQEEKPKFEISSFGLNLLPSMLQKVKSFIPQRRITVENPIEDEGFESKKKTTFSVGLILLFILAVSIIFGIKAKKDKEFKSTYEQKLIEAINFLNEAKSLESVDATKARELFAKSEQGLADIKKLNVKDPKVDDLEKRLQDERGEILGEYRVTPTLFTDLTLLSSGFSVSDISVSDNYLFLLDRNQKKLAQVEIENKKSKIVASNERLDGIGGVANYLDDVYGSYEDGIYLISSDKRKVIEKDWDGSDFLIYSYSGNFYLLNKPENKIYRFSAIGGGDFSSKQEWLSSSTTPDFSNVKRWVMDGSMYIQTSDAKILKLSQGSPQAFSLSGVYPTINKIQGIATNENSQFFYILDTENKRVVVTQKNGTFESQYLDERLGETTNIIVNEELKKLLLITKDKIYSIDLKHL